MNIPIKTQTQNAHQSSLENNTSNQSTSVVAEINSASNIGTLQASDTNMQARSVEQIELPVEIWTHIFSNLNRKALSPVNRVCSAWSGIVQQIRTSGTLDFAKEIPMSHEDLIAAIKKCSDLENLYASMSLYGFKDFTYEHIKNILNGIHSKGYANLKKILVSSEQIAAFTTIQATLYPEADARKIEFLQDPRESHAVEIRRNIEDMFEKILLQIKSSQPIDVTVLDEDLQTMQEIINKFQSSVSGLKLLSIIDPEKITEIIKFLFCKKDINLIKFFFENGVDLNIKKYATIYNKLLHKVIGRFNPYQKNDFEHLLLDLILNQGIDVNARNEKGCTPLFYCSTLIAELLLSRGADIEAKDNDGCTPLMYAIKTYSDEVQLITLLLDKGADIEAKDNQGFTPLMRAMQRTGHRSIVDLLLARKANPNAMSSGGYTVLSLAVTHMSPSGLRSFLGKCSGLNFEARNKDGRTPLFHALLYGKSLGQSWSQWDAENSALALIEEGADHKTIDNNGYSLLSFMEKREFKRVLKFLLDREAVIE